MDELQLNPRKLLMRYLKADKPDSIPQFAKMSSERAANMGEDSVEVSTMLEKREGSEKGVQLRRELGLFSAVNYILGVMIGSGIFVSPATALKHAGSVGLCLIVWVLSGVISFLGALAYAELGTVVSKSGGEYSYFQEAFGPKHRFWGPVPSFINSWVCVLMLRPAEVAIIVLTFSEYTLQPFTIDMDPDYRLNAVKLVSVCALFIMTYINMTSVKLFIRIQNVFGACKVIACLAVIIAGIVGFALRGDSGYLSSGFKGSKWNAGSISLALYSGLWAYDGWNSVTVVTEEIINPAVNIPLSLAIGVPLMTALYTFMNVAYMSVLSPLEMTAGNAVAVSFSERAMSVLAPAVPVAVAIATFGSAMSIQFGVTRVCYVAARSGHMVKAFSYVNIKNRTPSPAVAFQGLIALIFIIVGNINALIDFASFLLWVFYGLAMVALLVMRRTHAYTPRPYRVPTVIPYVVLLVAAFLAVLPIIQDPSFKYLAAIVFIASGIGVYAVTVYYAKTPKFMNQFTRYTQIAFECVPPTSDPSHEE